mmetsp:Transcript_19089/g.60045  ORF Transcript_19089/g.60045 Transcript_19089/m.60045 type:complete len:218 (-) Transcript_19089:31-684(-)
MLLVSLNRISDQWDDVVIFMGGSRWDSLPYKGLRNWTSDGRGISIVNLTLNNYDYTGMSGIYWYRDSKEVRADTYFYMHDATTVGPGFPKALHRMRGNFSPAELKIPRGYSANIYAFSHELVEAYNINYDVNLTKREAVHLEVRGPGVRVRGRVHPLLWFARHVTWLAQRQQRPDQDVYRTGHARQVYWYPDYDVTKYLLFNRSGDIGGNGNLKPIE